MNIVLGESSVADLRNKYIVLTLDTFKIGSISEPVTAFCVLGELSPTEMIQVQQWQDLHENLMRNYNHGNWSFCEHALEHLQGRWDGELDSFYASLMQRIQLEKTKNPDGSATWDPVIAR